MLLAAPWTARAEDERVYDYRAWGEAADTLRAAKSGERLALRSAFLVPGSVRVWINDAELPPEAYQANLLLGTVRILIDVPPGALVVVRYRRQPVLLSPVYSLRPAEVSRGDTTGTIPARALGAPPASGEDEAPNLTFGGTKSVSFTTATNRGSSLDQSLEATVEGQLTPTLKVRALLSDNNLPIQPEGNTEELEYFDKVFVELEGPNGKATVGDLSLDDRTSTFSPLTRQLRGISGAVWNRRGRVAAAAAETKGEFRTVAFRGTTGLQGPYPLLSPARTTPEVVIAGTERVYVDGARVERGPNRDYVIDYDAGSVTFTPRRLITTDTEISVDFEITAERYDRSTVMGAAENMQLGWGTALSVLFAREADDPGRPKTILLSKEDNAVLAAAGDDAGAAVTGGISQTDSSKGNYVLVPADSAAGTPDYFRFDEVNGDYLLSFVEVGAARGDYRRAGISPRGTAYFEFVGSGNGTYLVGRRLPLPESVELVTARVAREKGSLTFDGEWNVSDHDGNRVSPLDDGDNVGHAGQLRVGVRRGGAWQLGMSALATTLESRFRSFDRARPGYYYRDWNLEDVALAGREDTQELSASAERERTRVRYSLGRLERDSFQGLKHEATIAAGSLADRGVSARGLSSDMEGTGNDRTRRSLSVDAAWGVWKVVPAVTYGTETYRNAFAAAPDSGRAYDLYGVKLSGRNPRLLSWRLEAERRETDVIEPVTDDWIDGRRDDTYSGALSYASGSAAQAEVQVIHRRESDRITGGEHATDLARVKAGNAWDGVGLRADVDYEISQNDATRLQRSVVFVGEGKGDYNRQGEAVGKGNGDYTLVFLPTADATPVHTVGFNLRVSWKPSLAKSDGTGVGGWIMRNVSVEQTVGVREESTHEPAWETYLMLPSALQRDDATVFGTTTFRQDWSLLEGHKNVSLTLRYLREDREDNRFEGVRENVFAGERALRLSRSLSARLTATVEGGRRVDRREGEGIPAGTGSQYDVGEWSALVGGGVLVYPGANLDVDVKAAARTDAESAAEQSSIQLQPRLVWRLADQVNVFGTYDLARVNDRGDVAVRPLVFAREGTAHRWSLTVNLRPSRVVSVYGTYSGRSETVFTGRHVTEHEFRLETRAYF